MGVEVQRRLAPDNRRAPRAYRRHSVGRGGKHHGVSVASRGLRDAEDAPRRAVRLFPVLRSPGYPLDVDWLRVFFFHAEDGIRDTSVTGVQTCALPISSRPETRRASKHGLLP